VRLLLDTHALLWWLAGDESLPDLAQTAIADTGNAIFVSAASAWEVATKHRIGKLPGAGALAADFEGALAGQGFAPLSITPRHGQAAGALPGPNRDPFDRMLIAHGHAGTDGARLQRAGLRVLRCRAALVTPPFA
jgi:PIN domain nuclease of toxin-antitoxin system